MSKRVIQDLNYDAAVEIRARLDGLEDHPGWKLFESYLITRTREIRATCATLTINNDEAMRAHNNRVSMANAFDEVLQWVQDARAQCDGVIEKERK